MSRRARIFVALTLLGGAVLALGCGGAEPPAEAPPTKRIVGLEASTEIWHSKEVGPEAPAPSAAPTLSGPGDPPPPAATPAPAPEPELPPPPDVKVTNIGLHVGGGPNDAATKAPFERAIRRVFDDFKRCYAKIGAPGAKGTFGIDLHIDRAGGHPATSNARTALPGDEFRDCVQQTFETVSFDPPRLGPTTISYALRFDPTP